jgi:hypothetical protein
MPDLNGGRPYVVQGVFDLPPDGALRLPLREPAEGDTVIVRDATAQTHLRFSGGRWRDEGFVPLDRL